MKKLVLFYNPVSGHAAFKNKLDWIVEAFQRSAANGRIGILPGQFVQRWVGVLQLSQGLFTGLGIGVLPLGLEEAAQDHGAIVGL